MNVNVYTSLNGVEFNQKNDPEEFERVSKLLKLIKAPDFVQPSDLNQDQKDFLIFKALERGFLTSQDRV